MSFNIAGSTPQKAISQSPIVGIDLGTTNSLVAWIQGDKKDGRQSEILLSREGQRLIPSVVSFVDGEPVVGYAAKNSKITNAANTVYSVKRLLGRSFTDLKETQATLPYEILDQDGLARIRVGDRSYTAIEISAMILREVRKSAEDALGCQVTRAVITVPAYFNDSQRQATRTAGRLAGLEVLRIINEPTAAALAYGIDRKKNGLIAVYDLGGGTFDVSILKLHDGIFEVLATHGDTSLGGDDLDQVIAKVMADEIRDATGVDPMKSSESHAELLGACEKLKIELASHPTAKFQALGFERMWEREEFNKRVAPILERTRKPCEQALADAGLKREDLSDVVMVGGPTRLEVVQQMAQSIFGRVPNTSVHPDEVVAVGAAIQADVLAGHNKDLLLLDVVPLSLGIETYGKIMSVLIPRNTRIPTSAKEMFTTFVDRQTAVDIHVLQGERDQVDENRSLARFKLKNITPLSAGQARVQVTFLIDADGILQVAARDLQTQHEASIEVRPSFGLTDAEVEHLLADSAKHAEDDFKYRKLVDARNQAEPVLRSTEARLADAKRILPADEVSRIEVLAGDLRQALVGTDIPKIYSLRDELNQATLRLAELVVKEAIRDARGT